MRILAIPIFRNRWAYYCHSTAPTTSQLTKVVDWSSRKWEQLGTANPDTWKRKLYDRGNHLMNQLDYQEWFLKNVPAKEHIADPPEKAHVYYASLLDGSAVQHDLEHLLEVKEPYHKKYMYYSAYWIPLACTFVVVPVIPNIPLAYTLFRLYSHYKAYKGAQHLRSLPLEYGGSPELDKLLNTHEFCTADEIQLPSEIADLFKHSAKPNLQLLLQCDIPGVLGVQQITELSQHFESPGMEVELTRARYQMLVDVARQRFAASASASKKID